MMQSSEYRRDSAAAAALAKVVLVNEDIKEVVRNANSINLTALNAMLMARRTGTAASGFGVVAEEMRSLSVQLESSMSGLRRLSDQLLGGVTQSLRQTRLERILHLTAARGASPAEHLAPVLDAAKIRRVALDLRIAEICAALVRDLERVVEVTRHADSLAPMARIEASWAAEHQFELGKVSTDLGQLLRNILPVLNRLAAKLAEART